MNLESFPERFKDFIPNDPRVVVLDADEVDTISVESSKSNQCETNVYKYIKSSDKSKYFPVGGYFVTRSDSLVEHWWVYNLEEDKHFDITPDEEGVPEGYIKAYIGLVNFDINDEIANSDTVWDVEFLKGGSVQTIFNNFIKQSMKKRSMPHVDTVDHHSIDLEIEKIPGERRLEYLSDFVNNNIEIDNYSFLDLDSEGQERVMRFYKSLDKRGMKKKSKERNFIGIPVMVSGESPPRGVGQIVEGDLNQEEVVVQFFIQDDMKDRYLKRRFVKNYNEGTRGEWLRGDQGMDISEITEEEANSILDKENKWATDFRDKWGLDDFNRRFSKKKSKYNGYTPGEDRSSEFSHLTDEEVEKKRDELILESDKYPDMNTTKGNDAYHKFRKWDDEWRRRMKKKSGRYPNAKQCPGCGTYCSEDYCDACDRKLSMKKLAVSYVDGTAWVRTYLDYDTLYDDDIVRDILRSKDDIDSKQAAVTDRVREILQARDFVEYTIQDIDTNNTHIDIEEVYRLVEDWEEDHKEEDEVYAMKKTAVGRRGIPWEKIKDYTTKKAQSGQDLPDTVEYVMKTYDVDEDLINDVVEYVERIYNRLSNLKNKSMRKQSNNSEELEEMKDLLEMYEHDYYSAIADEDDPSDIEDYKDKIKKLTDEIEALESKAIKKTAEDQDRWGGPDVRQDIVDVLQSDEGDTFIIQDIYQEYGVNDLEGFIAVLDGMQENELQNTYFGILDYLNEYSDIHSTDPDSLSEEDSLDSQEKDFESPYSDNENDARHWGKKKDSKKLRDVDAIEWQFFFEDLKSGDMSPEDAFTDYGISPEQLEWLDDRGLIYLEGGMSILEDLDQSYADWKNELDTDSGGFPTNNFNNKMTQEDWDSIEEQDSFDRELYGKKKENESAERKIVEYKGYKIIVDPEGKNGDLLWYVMTEEADVENGMNVILNDWGEMTISEAIKDAKKSIDLMIKQGKKKENEDYNYKEDAVERLCSLPGYKDSEEDDEWADGVSEDIENILNEETTEGEVTKILRKYKLATMDKEHLKEDSDRFEKIDEEADSIKDEVDALQKDDAAVKKKAFVDLPPPMPQDSTDKTELVWYVSQPDLLNPDMVYFCEPSKMKTERDRFCITKEQFYNLQNYNEGYDYKGNFINNRPGKKKTDSKKAGSSDFNFKDLSDYRQWVKEEGHIVASSSSVLEEYLKTHSINKEQLKNILNGMGWDLNSVSSQTLLSKTSLKEITSGYYDFVLDYFKEDKKILRTLKKFVNDDGSSEEIMNEVYTELIELGYDEEAIGEIESAFWKTQNIPLGKNMKTSLKEAGEDFKDAGTWKCLWKTIDKAEKPEGVTEDHFKLLKVGSLVRLSSAEDDFAIVDGLNLDSCDIIELPLDSDISGSISTVPYEEIGFVADFNIDAPISPDSPLQILTGYCLDILLSQYANCISHEAVFEVCSTAYNEDKGKLIRLLDNVSALLGLEKLNWAAEIETVQPSLMDSLISDDKSSSSHPMEVDLEEEDVKQIAEDWWSENFDNLPPKLFLIDRLIDQGQFPIDDFEPALDSAIGVLKESLKKVKAQAYVKKIKLNGMKVYDKDSLGNVRNGEVSWAVTFSSTNNKYAQKTIFVKSKVLNNTAQEIGEFEDNLGVLRPLSTYNINNLF